MSITFQIKKFTIQGLDLDRTVCLAAKSIPTKKSKKCLIDISKTEILELEASKLWGFYFVLFFLMLGLYER